MPTSFPSRVIAWAACLTVMAAQGRADPPTFGVRSVVAVTPSSNSVPPDQPAGAGPAKIYAILPAQLVPSEQRLVKPVDGAALLQQVVRKLAALDYRLAAPGQAPEILLTVQYGRGWLSNPYLSDNPGSQAGVGVANSSGDANGVRLDQLINQSITGATTQLMDEKSIGYEEKIQRAGYEKLYFRVTAWEYPADPKARAKMLWKTTVVVDDPDHRDLNVIAPDMLAAGAPYFARSIPEGEIDVKQPMLAGRVKMGTPQVVEPPPLEKVATAPAALIAAPVSVAEPTRKFDLAAGDAAETLQAFSRQSGEEIIYPAKEVRQIKTNDVRGELSVRAALLQLLGDTGLVAVQDEKTGAFVIHQEPR